MRRIISILIIILLVCACAPTLAGASLSVQDIELVTVTAMQDSAGDFLMYRVFTKQATSLPTTIRLQLEPGAKPTDVQESNGIEWWKASSSQSGDVLTINLKRGRIAEVHVRTSNLFTKNADGTITATVPLAAQKGIVNVQPGATIPQGEICVSPEPVEIGSDFGTALLVASVYVDMTKTDAPNEMAFVFGEAGMTYSATEIAMDAAPEQPKGKCCWWPLVVLCVLFALLSILYWIVREREGGDEEPPEEDGIVEEDEIVEIGEVESTD